MDSPGPEPSAAANAYLGVSRSRGSILLIGARALNAAFNLISVPILWHIFGTARFDAVTYALVIHGLMGLADIGTVEVVQRQMSLALAKGDHDEVRELNRDQLGINLFFGLLLILAGILCGLLIPLAGGITPGQTLAIFVGLGLQSCLFRMNQSVSTYLSARQRFDILSLAAALGGATVTIVSVVLVYLTREPWAYVAGMLIGEVFLMVVLVRAARKIGEWALPAPALRWHRLKPILKLCAADYPNRASNYFAAWGDKLVLGSAVKGGPLVAYRYASRLPDALRDMLNPLAGTSLPSLSRDFHHSEAKFRENTLFSGVTVFFASALLMLVPTGFAAPLLQIWLGQFAPAEGEAVMIQMGAYQALQMYLAVMGYAFFAAAKRQLYIPLTAGNAVLSLVLTLPAYRAGGIAGIGWMNVGLGLAQTFGLWFTLRSIGFNAKGILPHALRILAILIVCLAFVAAGMAISRSSLLIQFPIFSLILAPTASLLALVAVVRLRLAELPDRLARRIPTLFRKVLDRSASTP